MFSKKLDGESGRFVLHGQWTPAHIAAGIEGVFDFPNEWLVGAPDRDLEKKRRDPDSMRVDRTPRFLVFR